MNKTAYSYSLYEEGEIIDDAEHISSVPTAKTTALYWRQ